MLASYLSILLDVLGALDSTNKVDLLIDNKKDSDANISFTPIKIVNVTDDANL